MKQEQNPSRWEIRYQSDEKHCQVLVLPLGPGTRPFKISTKLFNRIHKEWDGNSKTHLTGDFARALRELRSAEIDLKSMKQVSVDGVDTCYAWLEEYEAKMAQFAIQMQNKVKQDFVELNKQNSEKPAEPPEPPVSSELHDRLLVAAVRGFCQHAGPIADAEIISLQARKIATMVAGTREIMNGKS